MISGKIVIGRVCQVTGGGAGGVDEEVKRVQAECRYLSSEIQRLQEDNRKLRVSYSLQLYLLWHSVHYIDAVE